MPNLEVGKTRWNETLNASCSSTGVALHFKYPSGKHFPSFSLLLNWAHWERFVAWVELQRKEQALEESKQG
jgi:hypothetical protein